MSRTPAPFRQADLTRAMKAAKSAGANVARVEIEGGKIVLVLAAKADSVQPTPLDELEAWRRRRGQGQS